MGRGGRMAEVPAGDGEEVIDENDLKELSSADALTIEELYAAAYREAGA